MEGVIYLGCEDTLAPDFDRVDRRVQVFYLGFLEHPLLTNIVKPEAISYSCQNLILPIFKNHGYSLDFCLMEEFELILFLDPPVHLELGLVKCKLRMILEILDTPNHCVVDLFFLLVLFLNNRTMTYWYTDLILLELYLCDQLVFFRIVKGQLTGPFARVVALVYGYQVLELHQFLATEV